VHRASRENLRRLHSRETPAVPSVISQSKNVFPMSGPFQFVWCSRREPVRPECRATSRQDRATWVVLCLILCCGLQARGLEPTTRISQYGHTIWRLGQAGLEGVPTAITQTSDGYIWIGTSNGLYRFDGVQFSRWVSPDGKQLPNQDIYSLLGSRDGSLYIGTGAGLARLTGGHLYSYSGQLFNIRPLVEDQRGAIWMGQRSDETGTHVLCRVEEAQIVCLGTKDGFKVHGAYSIFSDQPGSVWIGNFEGIDHWKQGKPPDSYPLIHSGPDRTANAYVTAFAQDDGGAFWAGVVNGGAGRGLLKFQDGKWASYITPQVDGSKLAIRHLFAAKGGALWIGTTGNGIYKLHDNLLDHFGTADGLSGDGVNGFFQDREGNLWTLTDAGIDIFRDLSILTFSTREGLSDDSAQTIAIAANNDVWIGTRRGLNIIHGQHVLELSSGHGLPTDSVQSLYRDSRDAVWMADQAGHIFQNQGGIFTPISAEVDDDNYYVFDFMEDEAHHIWASGFESKTYRNVALLRLEGDHIAARAISPDTSGQGLFLAPHGGTDLWAGGYRRGLYWFHDERFDPVTSPIATGGFSHLVAEPDDGLWAFTAKHEIYFYRRGQTHRLTVQNGLPCDSGSQIVSDHHGFHWLFLTCGVARIPDHELEKWWHDPKYRLQTRVLTIKDGFRPGYAKVILSPDGRLWSTNGRIAQVIDPAHLISNTISPPVKVEHLMVDHIELPARDDIRLHRTPQEIEIDYAGLSYTVPELVRFQYMLEGYEYTWNEVGGRRQAFYSKLKPGRYTFRVLASNNDGIWDETGAALSFTVPPAWYQMLWFRILSITALGAFVYVLYLLRLHQYSTAMKTAFNERLEERGRIARELHDTLIQSVDGLMIYLQAAIDENDRRRSHQMLLEALDRADEVLAEGRERVHTLRTEAMPGNELSQALAEYGRGRAEGHGVEFLVTMTGSPRPLNPIVRDEAFCIAREALANAFQHSRATRIELEVNYDRKKIRVSVRDNGSGIEPNVLEQGRPGHWGLRGMRERAKQVSGQLEIRSHPDAGTEISITIATRTAFPHWLRFIPFC
jgi:signal transduction histidine kinase/ligand-binding sensor domain-containing protein